jgi:hypothetical protein
MVCLLSHFNDRSRANYEEHFIMMQEFNDGLQTLQEFIRTKPALLVGSGLSVSMGLPGMRELLVYLKNKIPERCSDSIDHQREWAECLKLIESLGFEEGLCQKQLSNTLLDIIVDETAGLIEIKDDLLRDKLIDRYTSLSPFALLVKHLIDSLSPSSPILDIITSNYDHIIEYSCDQLGVEVCTGFVGSHIKTYSENIFRENFSILITTISNNGKANKDYRPIQKVRILKPHGSLHWYMLGDKVFQSPHSIIESKRIMITPGSTKYAASLIDPVMNHHRELANQSIRSAPSVFVIGYGFSDDHLQTVLKQRIKSGMKCLILTKQLSEKALELITDNLQVIALEENDGGTKWHNQGESGYWDTQVWDLSTFVEEVLGKKVNYVNI